MCFAVAAREFAREWSLAGLEAFLCRFNCPNPWDGAWKGHATHILDLAFLLLNYNQYLSKGQQQAAERFADDVIACARGPALGCVSEWDPRGIDAVRCPCRGRARQIGVCGV